jgi:Na+-transporting NADH:ubiquinone oxidoreductase subunit NqrB
MRRRAISIVVAVGFAFFAFAGTEYLTQFGRWISLVGAFLTGVLAYVAFWKNPEFLFGTHLNEVRESAFKKRAAELRVLTDLDRFPVDWNTGIVKSEVLTDTATRSLVEVSK